jgi:SAM-dependent methyltransferase
MEHEKMETESRDILAELAEHRPTPSGAGWNGEASQLLRFEQPAKVIRQQSGFPVNDFGCGHGALCDHLNARSRDFTNVGCDVSGDMIRAAQARFANSPYVHLYLAGEPPETSEHGIASGIFNLRFWRSDAEWRGYNVALLQDHGLYEFVILVRKHP